MRVFPLAALGMFGLANFMACAQAQTVLSRDWSGVYLGASLGGAEGRVEGDASTSDGFTGSYFTPPDPEQIAAAADGTTSNTSFSGGVFGGFGQQFDNLYLGIEISANSLSFDERRTAGATYLSNSAGAFSHELSLKADWQATLRGRLGWAQDHWLVYVTGGAAATQVRMEAVFTDTFLGAGAAGRGSSKETRLGWVVGLGGEYALSDAWTIRGEYLYADYGKVDTSYTISNPAFPTLANSIKSSADFKTQTLAVGMSYRF